MDGDRMVELAQALARAKSRQDVPAAMALFHRDMVLQAPAFGTTAPGPVFIQFSFHDGLIARERFFFDLSALCAQSGVSTDAVRRSVFGDATGRETATE